MCVDSERNFVSLEDLSMARVDNDRVEWNGIWGLCWLELVEVFENLISLGRRSLNRLETTENAWNLI